ncbi:hypothetical protein FACS1894122_14750 [Alphaproteobacteria bacterium]|nr:hypothetical protein FACS1894122_14750 [Alphaproteobacteria bacterium]
MIEKRENELKKREQEIANREAEIEKREEEWSFILVRTDGMHLNNAKIINKGAESQLFVFKMLLKNKIDAVLNHKKVGLKWHQIADELGKEEEKTINEDQVRQIICRIRKNIIDKHGESVCDKVIQCTSE